VRRARHDQRRPATTSADLRLLRLGILHTYTRADALRDGELTAADSTLLTLAGFRWPLAYTRSAFEGYIEWADADSHRTRTHNTRQHREWNVLTALHNAIRAHTNPDEDTLAFTVLVVPRTGHPAVQRKTTLHANFGPGDQAEPVITVLSDLTEL
jgi:hypothetical protein